MGGGGVAVTLQELSEWTSLRVVMERARVGGGGGLGCKN